MADSESGDLFVSYIELTRDITNPSGVGDRRRLQWVVFPQLPARLAPGSAPVSEELTYFYREQIGVAHRSVWSYRRDDGKFIREMKAKIEAYLDAGWRLTPVITCEIHPTELADVNLKKKTPYRILNRLQKVARAKHGLDIS